MFRVRHVAFSLAILGVAASLPIDFAHARGQALYRHIHHASAGWPAQCFASDHT